ncbi:hypothetical protein UY3_06460 [Chelonia mydas]|uniref:Uncharacterized protein n=1 Tax=Chelonia mydas TaxID=8469 RepID=M7BGN0_CHEMY|nr:hypothetical protein UY3_06460 [Chelonia mydas]
MAAPVDLELKKLLGTTSVPTASIAGSFPKLQGVVDMIFINFTSAHGFLN